MKPILFNTEMVRAIQNGTKTVTRRAIKFDTAYPNAVRPVENPVGLMTASKIIRPPYQVGDILYVRETWTTLIGSYIYRANQKPGMQNPGKWHPSIHMPREAARIFLRVTDVCVEQLQDIVTGDYRTPLNINKEGLILSCCFCTHLNGECKDFIAQHTPQTLTCKLLEDYTLLWNSTVKKSDLDKYGWNANPWVTVNEFEKISKEEALSDG